MVMLVLGHPGSSCVDEASLEGPFALLPSHVLPRPSTVVPCSIGSLRLHSFGSLGGDGAIEISADLTIPEGDGKLVVTVVPWPIMEVAPRGSQLSS